MDFHSGRRQVGRIARLAAGWLLTLIGLALLVLPGPGILFLLPGLTLLSAESLWVRRLLRRLKQRRLVRRAMREAERAGIRFDLGADEDGPEPPSAAPPSGRPPGGATGSGD